MGVGMRSHAGVASQMFKTLADVSINILMITTSRFQSLLSEIKMNQEELEGSNHVLVEAIVTQQSSLIGQTLYQFNFRRKLSSFVLAIKRQSELLREKVAHIKLKFSDTLLILVPRKKITKI